MVRTDRGWLGDLRRNLLRLTVQSAFAAGSASAILLVVSSWTNSEHSLGRARLAFRTEKAGGVGPAPGPFGLGQASLRLYRSPNIGGTSESDIRRNLHDASRYADSGPEGRDAPRARQGSAVQQHRGRQGGCGCGALDLGPPRNGQDARGH